MKMEENDLFAIKSVIKGENVNNKIKDKDVMCQLPFVKLPLNLKLPYQCCILA